MRKTWLSLVGVVGLSMSIEGLAQRPTDDIRKGTFTGVFKLTPVDGSHMKVDEAISYSDGTGYEIKVPAGFITDGASIPRVLWTVVGSPFSGGSHGSYVEAAAVHDVGCQSHQYTWEITHMVFFEAKLDSGVDPIYAKLLYYGVRVGGPRWTTVRKSDRDPFPETVELPRNALSVEQVKSFRKELQLRESPGRPVSIQEIDNRTPLIPGINPLSHQE